MIKYKGLGEIGAGVAEVSKPVVTRFVVNVPDARLVGELKDIAVVRMAAGMHDEDCRGTVVPMEGGEPGEVQTGEDIALLHQEGVVKKGPKT